MAMKFFVQAECDRLNRMNRNVSNLTSFPETSFWARTRPGDFLITGGEQPERIRSVMSYVQTTLSVRSRPLLILDGTGGLEAPLIRLYTGRERAGLGTLRVYSPQYKGYDVFGGMSRHTVLQYLTAVTADRPRESEINPAYIEAVLEVVSSAASITMENIRALMTKSDSEILSIARMIGLTGRFIEILTDPGSSGKNFRSFYSNLEYAFSNIHCRDTAGGHNIFRDISTGGVIYINAQSMKTDWFYKYFSTVLDYISTSTYCVFDAVLYEITSSGKDGLLEHIRNAMQKTNETIGICCSNIAPLLQECPFIVDMPIHVLYTSGRSLLPAAISKSYDTYDYCFPKKVFRPGVFALPVADNWEIAMMKRDRIRPQDLNERGVYKLMKGHNGEEIALVSG